MSPLQYSSTLSCGTQGRRGSLLFLHQPPPHCRSAMHKPPSNLAGQQCHALHDCRCSSLRADSHHRCRAPALRSLQATTKTKASPAHLFKAQAVPSNAQPRLPHSDHVAAAEHTSRCMQPQRPHTAQLQIQIAPSGCLALLCMPVTWLPLGPHGQQRCCSLGCSGSHAGRAATPAGCLQPLNHLEQRPWAAPASRQDQGLRRHAHKLPDGRTSLEGCNYMSWLRQAQGDESLWAALQLCSRTVNFAVCVLRQPNCK